MNFPVQHLSDEAVAAYADGVLGRTARMRAERHLADCPECAYAVSIQREAVFALRDAPLPALPSGLLDRLRAVPTTTDPDVAAARAIAGWLCGIPSSWHVDSGAGRHRHHVRSPDGLDSVDRPALPLVWPLRQCGHGHSRRGRCRCRPDGRTACVRRHRHVAGRSGRAGRGGSAIGQRDCRCHRASSGRGTGASCPHRRTSPPARRAAAGSPLVEAHAVHALPTRLLLSATAGWAGVISVRQTRSDGVSAGGGAAPDG